MAISESIKSAAQQLENTVCWVNVAAQSMQAAGGEEAPVWVDFHVHQIRVIDEAVQRLICAINGVA